MARLLLFVLVVLALASILTGCASSEPIREHLFYDGESWLRCVDEGKGLVCEPLEENVRRAEGVSWLDGVLEYVTPDAGSNPATSTK